MTKYFNNDIIIIVNEREVMIMLKLGLYNKFGENVGSVLKDKNFSTYYVVELYGNIVHIKLSALDFWDFATPLGLSVGSF